MSEYKVELRRIPQIINPESYNIEDLLDKYGDRIKPEDLSNFHLAFTIAQKGHENQFRENGDPFLAHPIIVVRNLLESGFTYGPLLWSALMHDVPEDNLDYLLKAEETILFHQLEEEILEEEDWSDLDEEFRFYETNIVARFFGEETSDILYAVTKSSRKPITFAEKVRVERGNVRKILGGPDPACPLKGSDRLHNLWTQSLDDKLRLSRKIVETKNLYMPVFQKGAEIFPVGGAILLNEINEQLKVLEQAV